jgi:hypothetical protein
VLETQNVLAAFAHATADLGTQELSTSLMEDDSELLAQEEDLNLEKDPEYIQKRLQNEMLENLQAFEMERVKTLYQGKQYEFLPHMRCYQCGKFIGD